MVHAVLGHLPIGCPFAAGDGQQAGLRDLDGVIARECGGGVDLAGFDERPDTGEHTEDVGAGRTSGEITACGFEDEVDFVIQRPRLEGGGRDGRVGGPDHDVVPPRNGKHHAAVAGVGHHDCRGPGEEAALEHEVHSLAGRDHGQGPGVIGTAEFVAECTRGIDHASGHEAHGFGSGGFRVMEDDPLEKAFGVFDETGDGGVVEQTGPLLDGGLRQVDQQAAVVELSVVIEDAAAQAVLGERGDAFEDLIAREQLGSAEAVLARQQIIDFQPHPVERSLPPEVIRHDKRQIADEMRRVLKQEPTLLQGLDHQGHVALLEIPDAAMHQLRRPARGPLAKVALLEQRHAVPACRGIDGNADTRGSAADHDQIPRLMPVANRAQRRRAVHGWD